MSFFGKLFGSDSAIDKTIDTAGRLLDESFYTKEEAAADRAEARREAQGLVVEWLKATTGSRLARRALAVAITAVWLSLFLFATFMEFSSVWVEQANATRLLDAGELLNARIEMLTPAVMLILGFYFAAPYMGELAKGAIQKFGSNS